MSSSETESGLKFKMKVSPHASTSPVYSRFTNDEKASSPQTSSTTNPTSTNDLILCLDNNSTNPSYIGLVEKLSVNLELDSSKKKLELEEKRMQISMLDEEKTYKTELNKHDLLQKTFELKKKTSELDYKNKLRDLLIEAIDAGDFQKCSYLNLYLNNQSEQTNLYDINAKNGFANLSQNYLNNIPLNFTRNNLLANGSIVEENIENSNGVEEEATHFNNIDNFSEEASYVDEGNNNNNANNIIEIDVNNVSDMNNKYSYFEENETDNFYDKQQESSKLPIHMDQQQISTLVLNRQMNTGKNSPFKAINYTLGSRNIRHMICSSHKLEEYSNSAALKILFKGKCTDNDMCRRKEVHTHYLIDTTECRRHISLYFQSSKYGLKFYKTYQIKSQGELEKIIRTFKMRHV